MRKADDAHVWETYGMSRATYLRRKRLGIPLDAPPHSRNRPNSSERYSGSSYRNPPEKIRAIKEKYRNGVTSEILEEWIRGE